MPDELEQQAGARVARAFDSFAQSLTRLSAEADSFAAGFADRLRASLAGIESTVDGFSLVAADTGTRLGAANAGFGSLSESLRTTSDGLLQSDQRFAEQLDGVRQTIAPPVRSGRRPADGCARPAQAGGVAVGSRRR